MAEAIVTRWNGYASHAARLASLEAQLAEANAKRTAIRRFLAGEKPGVTSNIAEELSYGYGDCDGNGFWQYQLPVELVEMGRSLAAAREREGRMREALEHLKQLFDEYPNGVYPWFTGVGRNRSILASLSAALAPTQQAGGGE